MDRLVAMLSIFFSIFLMAAVSSSEAAQLAGEEYWKKVLPNTPMPRAIKNLLTRDNVRKDCITADGSLYVPAQRETEMRSGTEKPKGGAAIDGYRVLPSYGAHGGTEKPKGGAAAIDGYRVLPSYGAHGGTEKPKGGTAVDSYRVLPSYGARGGTEKPKGGATVDSYRVLPSYGAHGGTEKPKGGAAAIDGYRVLPSYGAHGGTEKPKGGATVDSYRVLPSYGAHGGTEKPKGGATVDGYRALPNYGAHGGTKIRYDADVAIFFLKKDLQTGTEMTLHFTDPSVSSATFISRREADSLPFTSSKLPDILNHFSIEPHSNQAAAMRQTLADCERAALEGEKKYCATSLESMIDFITIALGSRNIVALSTSVDKENSPKQRYKITSARVHKKMSGYNTVVCHALSYTYAVFYCHTTKDAETYQVSLVGKDGTNVKSVAICHTDTSRWDPAYIAFQMLGVKPGTVPVCHLLPQNHVVWTPK